MSMTSKPLVSVIIIFLDAEKFIREAVESVLAQTYENWELFLVDDGSSDGSTKIALRYANQFPEKVRYLEHEKHQNRGMSASRNLGLEYANGKYVAFLDADDVWLPQKLEEQVTILLSHSEAAMVYGPARYWYSWTGKPEDVKRDFVQELGVPANTLIKPPTLLTLLLQNEGTTPSPSGILGRREVIEQIGRFEESFRNMFEDLVFYAKLYLNATVFVAEKCWYHYRQHPDACVTTAVRTGQYHSVRLKFLTWLEKYLLKQGVKGSELWKLLQQQLLPYRHPKVLQVRTHIRDFIEQTKRMLRWIGRKTLPFGVRHSLRLYQYYRNKKQPPVGRVRYGSLRRTTPISRLFGFERGLSIDRYYIEQFVSTYASDVQGRVLEIADNGYTQKFGGSRVTQSDVLYVTEGNPQATIVADLTNAPHIPSDCFDCIIFTQTLLVIYEVRAAIRTLYRILKPGGVLLATFPGISQISRYDMDRWGDYWRFTSLSARRLFEETFPKEKVTVKAYGNVLSAVAFLHGLAVEDLKSQELDYRDQDYEVTITVRAIK